MGSLLIRRAVAGMIVLLVSRRLNRWVKNG